MKDLGKKKLLIIMGGTIGLVILIIIILLIYNAIFGKTSYKDIEDTVSKAAQKYYSDNSSLLPKSENEEITINDSALTAAGYLKNMNELTKKMKNVSCKATVIVSYAGGEYRYTPILDCGKDYATKTLSSYISSSVNKVYTGSGLYELNGELVYRGEEPANYVKFSGKTWRIVKVEDEKVIKVGATLVPGGELLEELKPLIEEKGYDLEVTIFDDYVLPNEALNNKETFILEIAQDGCHNCEEFNPIFKKVLKKYNLTAKQINLTKLSEEENTKIENLYNITGTPTVIFIEKGEEPSISRRIIGARDEDFIITKLGIAGYIKENK